LLILVLPARGGPDDPFKALDLIRPSRPMAANDFVVPGLSSPALRLRDFRGKVVFLNFWATWCLPSKEEMPAMERLYQRYKPKGLEILAISIDTQSAAAVQRFVKELKLTYPIGLDPKWAVAEKYTVRALPSSFLIDRKGCRSGGLFTSTMLTLFILPVVYLIVETRRARREGGPAEEGARA